MMKQTAHVLIVDDEQENLDALADKLRREQPWWTISSAVTVEAARDILVQAPETEKGPVDVVLTDLVMDWNKGGGIDVLEAAKEVDPLIMVIIFTAYQKTLNRIEAYDVGAFDCIEKNSIGSVAVDEIVIKANAAVRFRKMAMRHVKDQQRISMLKRYFDPAIRDHLDENPEFFDVQERFATIAFWDIRGFTAMSEKFKREPRKIQSFLAEYYELATRAIFDHGGILDKFIGDGIMSIFLSVGADQDESQTVQSAAGAALAFSRGFEELLESHRQNGSGLGPLPIGLGCGIHAGATLVGNLGSKSREQFTAIGPNVNLASRLESMAQPGQILLSERASRCLVDGEHRLEDLGERDVRGLEGKQRVYGLAG